MNVQNIPTINFSKDFQIWKERKKRREKSNGNTDEKNLFGVCALLSKPLNLENPPQFST